MTILLGFGLDAHYRNIITFKGEQIPDFSASLHPSGLSLSQLHQEKREEKQPDC